MKRWMLLLPFLLLPLACDDNKSTPIMPSGTSGTTGAQCEPTGGNCVSDADCCAGSRSLTQHVCQANSTCHPSGGTCSTSSDCCGGLVCDPSGYCRTDKGTGGGTG